MPLILPGNVASATASTGYDVDNSLRWNDGDSPYMSRANGTPTNADQWTFSIWVKRGALGSEQKLIAVEGDSLNNDAISFDSSDQLRWYGITSSSTYMDVKTNRVFRDPSAWMHLCFIYDSGQVTDSDRAKIYVNGTQETSLATSTYPDQNKDSYINTASKTTIIGRQSWAASGFFDGYMAEVTFCDGQALAPTSFGEFDSDSPTIFKPIDVSGLTFGTNGFYLDFEASDNLGNDANGGTDFTEFNLAAADQASDSPTNNFCVMNPLAPWTNTTYSEGNCIASGAASAWQLATGTIGVTKGKWYWEVLFSGGTAGNYHAGVADETANDFGGTHGQAGITNFYNGDGGEMYKGGADTFTSADYGTMDGSSDIVGIALNVDDSQISIYKNGSIIVTNFGLDTPANLLFPLTTQHGASQVSKYNFGGCPAFAITSGNTDGTYGNFEYAPPSGYYAICTKNLAEYG